MGYYDVAQICMRGHVVNDSFKEFPEHNKRYCDRCGSPTINRCQKCNSEIQGRFYEEDVFGGTYEAPAFCHNCGASFPWTETKIKAFQEYTELLDIPKEDKKVLEESISDIVISTETTPVSATKFKKILTKAGKNALEGAKEIVIDIISETAKKIIWP
jgi:hypothetical protein